LQNPLKNHEIFWPEAGAAVRHYRIGNFVLDTQTQALRDGAGVPVPLTAKAFNTLQLLVENRQRVVGKDELLATVWAGRVVEENNLAQAIAALRRAFGTGAGDHRYILTVPGHGYRFIADVDELDAIEAARPPTRDPSAAAGIAPAPARRRRALAVVLGAVVLPLLSVAAAWWVSRPSAETQVPAAAVATVAVLPFRPGNAQGRDELLDIGLAEALVGYLGRAPGLRARALASAQRLGGLSADPVQAGRRLGAAYIVDGTTEHSGDRVRVIVHLRSAADGRLLWSDRFEAGVDQVAALQDRMGGAVLGALGLPPPSGSGVGRSACEGDDPRAYRAVLRAHYLLQRRSPDSIAAFHQAIALDPTCAPAYAGLTMSYLFTTHNDGDPRELIPRARAASAQAIRLAPDSAHALTALGRQKQLQEWDWADAEARLRQAIAANPSLADARFSLAHLLVATGRFEEGIAQVEQAVQLDPLSPLIVSIHAGFLTAARRNDEAAAVLEDALELQPGFWIALLIRGGVALDRGDTRAAIADLERSAAESGRASQVLATLAEAYAAAGARDRAEAILRELEQRRRSRYVPATSMAAVKRALGQREAALAELERAYAERDIRMVFLKVDARWNSLRQEPRFRALATRMGLPGEHAYGRY